MKQRLSVWVLVMAWIAVAWPFALILWAKFDEVPLSVPHARTAFFEYVCIGSLAVGLALISYRLACHFLGRGTSDGGFFSMVFLGLGSLTIVSAAQPPYGLGTVSSVLTSAAMIYLSIFARRRMAETKSLNVDGT